MDLGLTGRTALITGASKGIGFAAAWSLAREGCNVHLNSRTEADLEAAIALAEAVSVPRTDPVLGNTGGLHDVWAR